MRGNASLRRGRGATAMRANRAGNGRRCRGDVPGVRGGLHSGGPEPALLPCMPVAHTLSGHGLAGAASGVAARDDGRRDSGGVPVPGRCGGRLCERSMMHEARKIISVHIPKTAGASFRAGLASVFGKRLLLDNDDRPLDGTLKARFRRARKSLAFSMRGRERFIVDYDAVHGHFIASKYSALGEQGALCAFFRDPARRVISQAAFWRRHPDPKNAMWVEFSRQKMTAERLAGFPRQQRIYALFTGGYSLERFAFVGVTEEYETSLRLVLSNET